MAQKAIKGAGKGWGDGQAVTAFNERRRTNPENTYTGFRPRVENEAAFFVLREWASDRVVNRSFSSIINAVLPGLMAAVQNTTEIDTETGEISIEINLGRIVIK
jgi:hypothetical protein